MTIPEASQLVMQAGAMAKPGELFVLKMGAPVIGMYDCAGLRLQEATDALDALGRLYRQQTAASGVIPQYAAVFGQCGGGTALLAALSDFTFMVKDTSALFVNAPNTLDDSCGAAERYAGAEFQGRETGNADFVCENEETLLAQLRELVLMLPFNQEDVLDYDVCEDDLNRKIADYSGTEGYHGCRQICGSNGRLCQRDGDSFC